MFKIENNLLHLENDLTIIKSSLENGEVLSVIDKRTGKEMLKESSWFIAFYTKEKEKIAITSLTVKEDVLYAGTAFGEVAVKVCCFDDYYTFELLTKIPEGIYKMSLVDISYQYEQDGNQLIPNGIPMTVWVDPVHMNNINSTHTCASVYPHLRDIGAKYALVIAPVATHCESLKKACLTIDKSKGIVCKTGGAWGRSNRITFGDYTIQTESSREFVESNLPFWIELGVDQIDFHQGDGTIRQGDFKFMRYDTPAEFKKHVSDVLEANGMTSGLHTYAQYIRYDCDVLLSKPEFQKDLARLEIFTLAKDIAAEDDFLPTEEDTSCLNPDYGFFVTNSCYMLVEEELIEFEIGQMGVKALARGCAGTKAVAHKKGVKVEHLSGLFNMLQPVFGSNLFYEVARLTAKAYNEGGFKMIYLDALDGVYHQSKNDDEIFYYCASFVHEIFKYVEVDPLIEYSCLPASLWIARGRNGAWDNAFRGYKEFNKRHAEAGKISKNCFMASTLGWFHYYPLTDNYPGNEHTKYLFKDAVEHMGSLAIMHDLSTVFSFAIKANLERWIGMRRNIAIYRKYDDLRKAQYFSEAYRQKLIDGKWEYHLVQKRGGKWRFVEKHYEREKLHDLGDAQRNTAEYTNPFRAQVPFVRIEALLSTKLQNPFVMLPLDEHRDLTEQVCECDFGREVDLSDKLAKHVRVLGNGKKGGKIAIKTRCATRSEHGYGEYIIDTDFEGWRDFVIVESDNGERRDHHFEDKENFMSTYRSGLNSNRITKISLEFEGDLTGVRMTSVIAYEHTYEMLKNPTVKVGDTQVMFECELLSSDYIEFDGKEAFIYDRHGNAKKIWFESNLAVPKGKFTASLTARALNRTTPRAILTFGYTGKEIKE